MLQIRAPAKAHPKDGQGVISGPVVASKQLKGPIRTLDVAPSLSEQNYAQGGYGLTEVDADLWTSWRENNKDNPIVTGGFVFAEATLSDATAAARELGPEVRTGMEPIDPEKPGHGVQKATAD